MARPVAGSFRDPAGFVYEAHGVVFRAISTAYREQFQCFTDGGLYRCLLERKLILPFECSAGHFDGPWKTIRPEQVPFVSYPYEWSFGQLRDAALATLDIQLDALRFGMSLRDASAYNVQFVRGYPQLIDHLSFERLREGQPWGAYRQFVMHFLGPLALMAKADIRHGLQLRNFIDGLPLDYVSASLPAATWLRPALLMHLHMHAAFQRKYAVTGSGKPAEARARIRAQRVSAATLKNLALSLRAAIEGLRLPPMRTEWGHYYEDTRYTNTAFAFKKDLVNRVAARLKPARACDLGANDGEFSRILAQHAGLVVSADVDPLAVHNNYQRTRSERNSVLAPVLQDLCNPSPALGWANEERPSFLERARCDFVMGLALIHHLCIGNNLPLAHVAKLFRFIAPNALVEFVPKEDEQVGRLLLSREDIFPDYSLASCIDAFRAHYSSVERFEIPGSARTLLLFF